MTRSGSGMPRLVEVGRDRPLVDPVGGDALGDQGAHRIHDLGATAVVEGDAEGHPLVAAGQGDDLVHVTQDPLGHPPVATAGEHDPHPPLVELLPALAEDRVAHHVHEEPHLVRRAAPVLRREGVHRQPRQTEVERPLHHVEQRLLPGPVALGAGQAAPAGPAPVAVHDTGDVAGSAGRDRCPKARDRG